MKNNFKSFNFIFNIFIILGMVISVVYLQVLDPPDEAGTSRIMQIVVAVGAVMGVMNMVLSASANIWNFLFGIFEVSICAYANYVAGNMGIFIQHLMYFLPMQFIGIWQWHKRGAALSSSDESSFKARTLTKKHWIYLLIIFVISTLITYSILYFIDYKSFTNGEISEINRIKILLDASIVVLNTLGQILLALAFVEQWYIWNLVNIASLFLWINTLFMPNAPVFTSIMISKYAFYLLNSLNGLRIWLHLSKKDRLKNCPHNGNCC